MEIYSPREDSELLAKCVEKYARGKVLDMGTGSGIQALKAANKTSVTKVFAVDINSKAVKALPKHEKIFPCESDMFSALENENFDTIICNPPYLPDEQNDTDPALYGGPGGYEWCEKFLKEAKNHLNKDGQILFLFSSLTNKERIDKTLKKLSYNYEQIMILAMFFERLYVYRIRKNG